MRSALTSMPDFLARCLKQMRDQLLSRLEEAAASV